MAVNTPPVTHEMQAVFLDNWIKATGKVLHGDDYFPVLTAVGDHAASLIGGQL